MATVDKQQTYFSRDYDSIRQDLIDLLKSKFPEQYQDFNVASPGMGLVEILAWASDILSYNTDKKFNSLFRDGIKDRVSAFRLAKTFGYKPIGYRPSVTLVNLTLEVPALEGKADVNYLPVINAGMQVRGQAQVFETLTEVDFSSDYSDSGTLNRLITPIFNANQDILRYKILKQELVKAGTTVIKKFEISTEDSVKKFLEFTLPENNVLEIISVIVKPGIGLVNPPTYTEFNTFENRYWEVDELAENKVFIEDDSVAVTDGIKVGNYVEVTQRFTKNFNADGTCMIRFGAGTPDYDAYEYYLTKLALGETDQVSIKDILNSSALGTRLPANSTLYVKYRVGGGTASNIGTGVLTQVTNLEASFVGADENTKQTVLNSVKVVNPLPADGGTDLQDALEIVEHVAANYASQKRGVTLNDYVARAYQMPGKFGGPFRIHAKLSDNKVKYYILSKDSAGRLNNTSSSVVKNNLVNYLKGFRMINDFIEVNDGKIINLQIEVDLFVNKIYNGNEVKVNVINAIKDFLKIDNWTMNQPIYVSQMVDMLREIAGVINIVDIRFYNMEGGNYSNTLISQATGTRQLYQGSGVARTQIELINNAIYSSPISMFEVRFPDQDIMVRLA